MAHRKNLQDLKCMISVGLTSSNLTKLECAATLCALKSRTAVLETLIDTYLLDLVKSYIASRGLPESALVAFNSKDVSACISIHNEAAYKKHFSDTEQELSELLKS